MSHKNKNKVERFKFKIPAELKDHKFLKSFKYAKGYPTKTM